MPHAIEMKDGKILTPFGIRDLLEAVSDYAGEELAREIESYINTNVEDIDDYAVQICCLYVADGRQRSVYAISGKSIRTSLKWSVNKKLD